MPPLSPALQALAGVEMITEYGKGKLMRRLPVVMILLVFALLAAVTAVAFVRRAWTDQEDKIGTK